jgi:hypothetical protein
LIAAVRARWPSAGAAGLAFAASCVFLLARPALRGEPNEAAVLLAGYALIAATAWLVPIPPAVESPTMRPSIVLVVGLGSVSAAAIAAGRPVPAAVTWLAPAFNVIAAVAEEAVFRRVAFGWLSPLGVPVAIAACAITFALVHVPIYGLEALPVDLGAGLLLSWQRAASGTWTVPAATHAAANVVALIR